jgi:hypothetical protein
VMIVYLSINKTNLKMYVGKTSKDLSQSGGFKWGYHV